MNTNQHKHYETNLNRPYEPQYSSFHIVNQMNNPSAESMPYVYYGASTAMSNLPQTTLLLPVPNATLQQCRSLTGSSRTTNTVNCDLTVQANIETTSYSGFLIDNCDEEEELPEYSPSHRSSSTCLSTTKSRVQPSNHNEQLATLINEERAMLVNELNVSSDEQRRTLKRKRNIQRKLRRKLKRLKQSTTTIMKKKHDNDSKSVSTRNVNRTNELPSNSILESNRIKTNSSSSVNNTSKKSSTISTMTDDNEIIEINLVLKKVKDQQKELTKLRKSLMAMLDEKQKDNVNSNQDHLLKLLHQPIFSGCWLCSGKSFTEVSTQCNTTEQ
ncbi:hypothetical protein I4U23_017871 [Adineta vaga]|nr:hypothetical protein I4U23_017871 [Adineta vaga]